MPEKIPVPIVIIICFAVASLSLIAGISIGADVSGSPDKVDTYSVTANVITSIGVVCTVCIAYLGLNSWKEQYHLQKHDQLKLELSTKMRELIDSIRDTSNSRLLRNMKHQNGQPLTEHRLNWLLKTAEDERGIVEQQFAKATRIYTEIQSLEFRLEKEPFDDLNRLTNDFLCQADLTLYDLGVVINSVTYVTDDVDRAFDELIKITSEKDNVNQSLSKLIKQYRNF